MIEHNILGYLLTNNSYYFANYQELRADMFADPQNRAIFEKYVELIHADKATLLSMSKHFAYDVLSSLTASINYSLSFVECLSELKRTYIADRLTMLGDQIKDGEVDDRIRIIQDTLSEVRGAEGSGAVSIAEGITSVLAKIGRNRGNKGLSGIGTGIEKYDTFTGGWQPSDLVVVAGETSQGKTSLALSMIRRSVIQFGAKACIFSYEMTEDQIITRLISQQSGVNSKRLMTAQVSDEELEKAGRDVGQLRSSYLWIDPCKNTSVDYLCNNLRAYRMRYGIQVAVIDYLQLLRHEGKRLSREQEVGENARHLKNIAKELGITVVALSQLSRDKYNPKPSLNRLRDSGQIEEAADQVLFVYRPEMYSINTFEDTSMSTEGMAHIILAKGRNVGVCSFYLDFDKFTTEFSNHTDYDFKTTAAASEHPF